MAEKMLATPGIEASYETVRRWALKFGAAIAQRIRSNALSCGDKWHLDEVWAKAEHPFRVIKRQFGHVKVRYRGLAKNTAQLHTLFALANLWMARRRLQEAEV